MVVEKGVGQVTGRPVTEGASEMEKVPGWDLITTVGAVCPVFLKKTLNV